TKADFINIIQKKLQSVLSKQSLGALCVAVGVHEPTKGVNKDTKVQNNQLWISELGVIEQRYQKIHLFDINIPNGPILQESRSVEAGNKILCPFPVSDNAPGFKVGFSICYDIRFPELAARLRQMGANILTYPSAFTTKTGEAHWLELGRARAIDSQCYVVMAAQCGEHDIY
ncbi:carbon-nitrogen hydrolase, partial [Metschnikowia bicuspidata var. bicuspidata NRRL YB-4993]